MAFVLWINQEKSIRRKLLKILKKGRIHHPIFNHLPVQYVNIKSIVIGNENYLNYPITNREKRRLKGIYPEIRKRLEKICKACKFTGKLDYSTIEELLKKEF